MEISDKIFRGLLVNRKTTARYERAGRGWTPRWPSNFRAFRLTGQGASFLNSQSRFESAKALHRSVVGIGRHGALKKRFPKGSRGSTPLRPTKFCDGTQSV